MRSLFGLILTLATTTALAAPDPFGMEMTKDCDKQLEGKDVSKEGVNKYSKGPMYDVGTAGIDFRGLKSVSAICDLDGQLVAVIADLNKQMGGGTFDRLVKMLRGKYEAVNVDDAFVGSKSAEFRAGNVVVKVNEPHMSHTTKLEYLTDDFLEAFKTSQRQEQQQQQQEESNAL